MEHEKSVRAIKKRKLLVFVKLCWRCDGQFLHIVLVMFQDQMPHVRQINLYNFEVSVFGV